MNAERRSLSMFLAAGIAPAALSFLCASLFGLGPAACAAAALVFGAVLGLLCWRSLSRGLIQPCAKTAATVKDCTAAGYMLSAAMPKEGWPEAAELAAAANRILLELAAYRGFRINQVLEERGKAEALMETIDDGVMLLDGQGKLICSNNTALKLLGISGPGPKALPGSETNPAFTEALAQIVASEDSRLRLDVRAGVPGDVPQREKDFQVVATRFRLATLNKPGWAVVLRDVSLEKEIEETKQTFFQMITHDMRAPLSAIKGYAEVALKKGSGGPEFARTLEIIQRAAQQLNALILDILDMTRLERGDMPFQPSSLAAHELLARACEIQRPEAAKKGVFLTIAEPGEKLYLRGDGALLERVLVNLVGNAVKFTPREGRVTLSAKAQGKEAVFTVEDTGPGIPADQLDSIFEKYAQLEEHRSLGFGLGLTICKSVAQLHGGRIWAESEPGKGSRFLVALPL